jgi:hypothetical protein
MWLDLQDLGYDTRMHQVKLKFKFNFMAMPV